MSSTATDCREYFSAPYSMTSWMVRKQQIIEKHGWPKVAKSHPDLVMDVSWETIEAEQRKYNLVYMGPDFPKVDESGYDDQQGAGFHFVLDAIPTAQQVAVWQQTFSNYFDPQGAKLIACQPFLGCNGIQLYIHFARWEWVNDWNPDREVSLDDQLHALSKQMGFPHVPPMPMFSSMTGTAYYRDEE